MAHFRRQYFIRSTYCSDLELTHSNRDYAHDIERFVIGAFDSDLGNRGDITSSCVIDTKLKVKAMIVSKSSGVLAGKMEVLFLLKNAGKRLRGTLKCHFLQDDGSLLYCGSVVAELQGFAVDILAVERTVLNVLQRMSGIATLTRDYVLQLPSDVLLLSTRKTLWGRLDKRACFLGGAGTHRLGLSDAVLVKDNHIAVFGDDFDQLLPKLFSFRKKVKFIEIEVASVSQAKKLLTSYSSFIRQLPVRRAASSRLFVLLDNMKPAEIKQVLTFSKNLHLGDSVFFEASGGIDFKNIGSYAKTGVDLLSVGALTHSAKALDLSLDIQLQKN